MNLPRFRQRAVLACTACTFFVALATAPLLAQTPAYEIVNDGIPAPLTAAAGSPARGKALLAKRERAVCLKCHSISQPDLAGGNKGPSLDGVGAALTPAQLRLTVAEPTRITRNTEMPNFHKRGDEQPKLTAQEVEDVVAFLGTLKR